jgi:hypothetical protein
MTTLQPSFLAFKAEASVIGRLLAGYGELEYALAYCLANTIGNLDAALRTLFVIRGEAARLDVANSLMHDDYHSRGMGPKYDSAISDIRHCRKIRNTFAHCHWSSHDSAGLFYVNLEDAARDSQNGFKQQWLHVDMPLMMRMIECYETTQTRLWWLDSQHQVLTGREDKNPWQWPSKQNRPPMHNPRSRHRAPWQL